VPAEGLSSRFSTWLLRPYLDLGPCQAGPLHTLAVEEYWRAFIDLDSPHFVSQRALPPGFRLQLAKEAGEPYVFTHPSELGEGLRTARWRALCDALRAWDGLSGETKCRLALLLHGMCLYRPLLTLIPSHLSVCEASPCDVDLAFLRASAGFMDGLRHRTAEYAHADLSVFEDIALNAHQATVRFNAVAIVFVHKAKTHAPLPDLSQWAMHFENALSLAIAGADDFTKDLFTSRFFRGLGFLPQRRGDKKEVLRIMDLAESHALRMRPATPAQRILYRENLHALMESRTKEALWLEDKEQALDRALKVIEVDPLDSKAWMERGDVHFHRKELQEAAQAYATAAMLGPPASAAGRHMAAVCFRELGQDLLASLFFRDTLEIDQLGISPREEIRDLPDLPVLGAIKEWSRRTTPL
jgi:tetratricopeptide (TPR) repeat protein